MKKNSGFTLVELMITLVVAAIILSIGVPSFNFITRNNQLAAMSNELVSALSLARSEAIKKNETLTLCSTTDGATCATSTNWQTGWVLLDVNKNVLHVWDAMSTNTTLKSSLPQIQYLSSGFVNAAATLQLRADGCTGDEVRNISISVTGRPTIEKASCS